MHSLPSVAKLAHDETVGRLLEQQINKLISGNWFPAYISEERYVVRLD
jgi:hypothetical protein